MNKPNNQKKAFKQVFKAMKPYQSIDMSLKKIESVHDSQINFYYLKDMKRVKPIMFLINLN